MVPLLYPFVWQGIYIPVLPINLHEYLDAPVPFIVGNYPTSPHLTSLFLYILSPLLRSIYYFMIFNEYNIGLQSLRRRNLETIIVDLNANKLIFDGCSQPVALPEYKKLYLT